MADMLYLFGWNQLIAILMGMAVWLLCRTSWLSRRPALCHGLWLLVLLKLVTPPVVEVPMPPIVVAEEASDATTVPAAEALVGDTSNNRMFASTETTPIADSRGFANYPEQSAACCREPVAVDPPEPPPPIEPPSEARSVPGRTVVFSLLGISVFITGLLWMIAARRVCQVRRLLRGGEVESGRAAELLREVSCRFSLRAAIRLRVVDAPITPMLWAAPCSPAIVLPRGLADSLGKDGLRSIFAHELAHFARRDHWTNLFSLLVASLFWWNPLVWFACRQRSAAAEACCDAMALEQLGSRKSYAETLLRVVDSLGCPAPRRAALAIPFGESHSLKRRFEMIADNHVKARMTRGGWALLAVGLTCLVLVPARAADDVAPSAAPANTEDEAAPPVLPSSFVNLGCPDTTTESKKIDLGVVEKSLNNVIDEAIAVTGRRMLSSDTHTPWQIGHAMLAYRHDCVLRDGEEMVNAFDWVATNPTYESQTPDPKSGSETRTLPWFNLTKHGARPQRFTGQPYEFEGHSNQFLAFFALAHIPVDFEFTIEGQKVTFGQMLHNAKMEINDRGDVAWTLWTFAHYFDMDDHWNNAAGEPWSMERLVSTTLKQFSATRSPCGGCHALFALAIAQDAYMKQTNARPTGVWTKVKIHLDKHIALAKSMQNADGSFSSNYFRGPGYASDPTKRISTSGHTLAFLMVALPPDRLQESWVRNAVESVARDLIDYQEEPLDVDGMYHAAYALMLYRERVQETE